MKPLSAWKSILTGITGFLLGLWLFFPWNALCDYSAAAGLRLAAENGIYASIQSNTTDGIFNKAFVYNGIQADFPVFRAFVRELRVEPSVISSLSSGELKCAVTFGRGELVPVTRQKLEWQSGGATITLGKDSAAVSDIDVKGKFSASGFIEISKATGKLSRAALTLKIPPEMDRAMQLLGTSGMIPVRKIGDGEWMVER